MTYGCHVPVVTKSDGCLPNVFCLIYTTFTTVLCLCGFQQGGVPNNDLLMQLRQALQAMYPGKAVAMVMVVIVVMVVTILLIGTMVIVVTVAMVIMMVMVVTVVMVVTLVIVTESKKGKIRKTKVQRKEKDHNCGAFCIGILTSCASKKRKKQNNILCMFTLLWFKLIYKYPVFVHYLGQNPSQGPGGGGPNMPQMRMPNAVPNQPPGLLGVAPPGFMGPSGPNAPPPGMGGPPPQMGPGPPQMGPNMRGGRPPRFPG